MRQCGRVRLFRLLLMPHLRAPEQFGEPRIASQRVEERIDSCQRFGDHRGSAYQSCDMLEGNVILANEHRDEGP